MQLVIFVSENNKLYSKVSSELTDSNRTLANIVSSSELILNIEDYFSQKSFSEELFLVRLHCEDNDGEPLPSLAGWFENSRTLCWEKEQLGYNFSIIRYTKKKSALKLSVVLSTCNQPEWLEKVLWGYNVQQTSDFELIIADDGSGRETYDMLQRIMPDLVIPVKHIWHEDKGFRKCDILNKGILAAQTDYLLFSDGDCIPRADFVSTHLELRRKGRFLSGGYHKLGMELSKSITKEDILSGHCFDIDWLRERGMAASFKNNKLTATGCKRWVLNTFTPTNASWNGHNASGWLTDILAVNGFDERMQYGGQDREFGERMENRGVRGMQIRYSTVCLHLDHARGYKTKESIQKNVNIRKDVRKRRIQWTPYGIIKEELAAKAVAGNYWYDLYEHADERLDWYKQKGGIYRHLYSLPCRWRKKYYQQQVINTFIAEKETPVLSNRSGMIVSLTTFPPRIAQLHLVLKSILWQTYQPERIIIWLSEEEFPKKMDDLPEELKQLVTSGVEFRFVPENLRSHKKYHYAFQEYPDKVIVTVDDDLIYPRNTLERLVVMSHHYPGTVCGNCIRKIQMKDGRFEVYKKWKKVTDQSINSSYRNVAIGCGGVLYPPAWFDKTLFDKEIIREKCMVADDLWLKANELIRGVKVSGGGGFFPHPVVLPDTQRHSLQKQNNGKINLNDEQWSSLTDFFKLDKLYLEQMKTDAKD